MKVLRGHHMFCTALFSGSGYDQAFTENMTELIQDMQKGETFRLVQGHDDVCRYCPNRKPDGCTLGTADVSCRDASALEVTGLAPGRVLDWDELRERLAQVSETEFQQVCGDCRWQKEGLCSYQLLHRRMAGQR